MTPPSRLYYLSGPMTGLPEYNYPFFHRVAKALRGAGYSITSPAELSPPDSDWHSAMRRDIAALCTCTDLILLPEWENSQGAHLELMVAHRLGLRIHSLSSLLPSFQ